MTNDRKLTGIIIQVAMLFVVSMLTAAVITFMSSYHHGEENVKSRTSEFAARIADETAASVQEFPAWEWLLSYWYTHADSMEIEYDAGFGEDTETARKCRTLLEHHPGLLPRYVTAGEIEALPEEDQKLYAEITYSWMITRINEIKRAYKIDYLFCVVTDTDYLTQFFLFSGADPGSVRGTEYEQVYPLGVTVSVADNQAQQDAMRNAKEESRHLAAAGNYMDFYSYLCNIGEHPVLIGMTYNLGDLNAHILKQVRSDTKYTLLHQICLALICMVLIYFFVIVPLKQVQQSIRLYKNTKDSRLVREELAKVRSGNEIGDLAEDVSALTGEIDDYLNRIETITAERERIGTELALAARIQESMLPNEFPPFPDRKDFDIYASMMPAKEVGGDFYDFFLVDQDHLALVIADVSGKGVPAALFMTVCMQRIHNTVMLGKGPAEALQYINEQICADNREEMFVSVWLGILDLRTGSLAAANAGHEYPVLKEPDGHFELLRDKHGFVIGGLEEAVYRDYTIEMKAGAKLFLYTDGVPEASDKDKNMFGMERMVEALREKEDGTPEEILAAVNESVRAFAGGEQQFDDLTMLCLHYRGKQE